MFYLFEVHIRPGYSAEQYAEAWVRASQIIQQAPGARGTRLHRKIDCPDVLLAIASWESKAQRDAMEDEPSARVQAIMDIHFIGEFEDPAWEVTPEQVAHLK